MTEPERVYDGSVYEPITRADAEAAFQSGDGPTIVNALLRLSLAGPDRQYAEECAIRHIAHRDVWVRRNAATSLGHIARITGELNLDRAMPALVSLLADAEVFGYADDALRDVEHFLGVNRGAWLGDARIRAIGYSEFDEVVEVQTADGAIVQYMGVDPSAYLDLWTQPDLLARLQTYPRRRLRKPRITRRSELKAG